MIRRRRVTRYSELTSLLDVLFILLFAALIQAQGVVRAAKEDRAPVVVDIPEPERPPVPAAVAQAFADADAAREQLRERALSQIAESAEQRRALYLRVSASGELLAIERTVDGTLRSTELRAPLVTAVDDPDIALVYASDGNPELRLCTRARIILGLPDLRDVLIVVHVDAALRELPVALVEGLRADVDHCITDERGMAVLVPEETDR